MTDQPPTSSIHKKDTPMHLRVYVIVVSDSRYNQFTATGETNDISGNLIKKLAEEYGHSVVSIEYVPDEIDQIQGILKRYGHQDGVDLLIFTGGTGLTTRDVTIEAVTPLLQKILPGFGELFRKLSYDEIGSAAMLTRALAGVFADKIIFCLPGSPNAVKLAMERLILLEVGHILKHVRN
ncbi:MAG: molybdenum cofactor biosynthesis protein B [Promethearchaeota archaeon]